MLLELQCFNEEIELILSSLATYQLSRRTSKPSQSGLFLYNKPRPCNLQELLAVRFRLFKCPEQWRFREYVENSPTSTRYLPLDFCKFSLLIPIYPTFCFLRFCNLPKKNLVGSFSRNFSKVRYIFDSHNNTLQLLMYHHI